MEKQILEYLQSFMTHKRIDTIRRVINERTKHFTVVVEDVYQAHNTSAVVRTCDVFGIQEMYTTQRLHKFKLSTQIAKGAEKWVDIHSFSAEDHDNNQEAIDTLRKKGYQIVATSPHYGSASPLEFDISKPSAIFFGTEKEGLSKSIIDQADAFIKIPMFGFTESLNISVSAAIILQTLVERLKKSGVKWQLSPEEKFSLEYEWSKKSVKDHKLLIEKFIKKYKNK